MDNLSLGNFFRIEGSAFVDGKKNFFKGAMHEMEKVVVVVVCLVDHEIN